MANTVNILSFANTFGDLLVQQNRVAGELNTLGANNYTKNSGTLILNGAGTSLNAANTTVLANVTATTISVLGAITSTSNVFLNGANFGLYVANNVIIGKTITTDQVAANTLLRTVTLNTTGSAFVNGLTSNTLIRTTSLNSQGATWVDGLSCNTYLTSAYINSTANAYFNVINANNTIYAGALITGGAVTAATITGSFTGQGNLTGVSLSNTPSTNTSNTQIATTAFVQNQLNAGNTYTHSITGNAGTVTNGVYTNGSYADPTWLTSLAGSKITGNITGNAGNITAYTINQSLGTSNGVQHASLGIGTAASGTTGEIRATNNITAYYSDDRLKKRLGNIENALAKVMTLNGFQYEANETAQALGYAVKPEIGLSAQEVQAVLPEVVVPAPIDEKYLTIHYERVIPLLVEAIKELKKEIDELKK